LLDQPMKAVQQKETGFVEILLRASVYAHLREVLGRYASCSETADDSLWLETFVANLDRRDAEDLGVN